MANRATSPLGRAAVLKRRPISDREEVARELERLRETVECLRHDPEFAVPLVPDAWPALGRLGVEGGVLAPLELFSIGVLLRSSRILADSVVAWRERAPSLQPLGDLLHRDRDLEQRIGRTVDGEGVVLDSASRKLSDLRKRLQGARQRVVRRLEDFARKLPERFAVSDASVTIREGRYVVPVRREGKGDVGGIVHDESASGATLFVEPPVAIELMNEVKELERAEVRETQRVLREVTALVAPEHERLADAQNALVDFDSLYARARAAVEWGAEPPELRSASEQSLRIVAGRHPLLIGALEQVVPFSLELGPEERCLVVSGPNTGGKSVFLKSVGLVVALTQSGCIPPVGAGTVLPVFRGIFADIGDEQSISESLSTYSAHLERLREILAEADDGSLVLIDELGTGTDPAEGAALARAILEELVERGVRVVVTSHLGALKALDTGGSGIVNGSFQFDSDRMQPTFAFVKGRPGRSYGLAIARRLGFPDDVVRVAERHLSEGEASIDDLLERLERKERAAERERVELDRARAEAERTRAEVAERERDVTERERTADRRASEEARKLLLEARSEVEAAIAEVRSSRTEQELEEKSQAARRSVEEAAGRHRERSAARDPEPPPATDVEVGMRVRLAEGGRTGTVLEVDGDRATVDVGGLRIEAPASRLAPLEDPSRGAGSATRGGGRGGAEGQASGWTGPTPEAPHEVDLRGLRVDEVALRLGRGIDAAVVAELGELRIIHGKGTGAVRSRVQELLRADARVSEFRLGRPAEGGAGVTVAKVR